MASLQPEDVETLRGIQAYGELLIVTRRGGKPVPGAAGAWAWAETLRAGGMLLLHRANRSDGFTSVAYTLTPESDALLRGQSPG